MWLVDIRRNTGRALFLGWAWPQPRQTASPRGQCSPVGRAQTWVPMSRSEQWAVNSAHCSAVGALLGFGTVARRHKAAMSIAIVGDELVRDYAWRRSSPLNRGRVPEQRLDHVDRGMGVEVLGGEHAAAVVRSQDQRGSVGVPGAGLLGEPAQPPADGVGVDRAGVRIAWRR